MTGTLPDFNAGSAAELTAKLESASIDLIFTDPRFLGERFDAWRDLGELAVKVLKPGALMLAVHDQYFIPQYLYNLTEGGGEELRFVTLGGYLHKPELHPHKKIVSSFKPVFVFSRGEHTGPLSEYVDSETGWMLTDTDGCKPSQVISKLLKPLISPGDVVLDPFANCGTTEIAATELGCEFIGCDGFVKPKNKPALGHNRERMAMVDNFMGEATNAGLLQFSGTPRYYVYARLYRHFDKDLPFLAQWMAYIGFSETPWSRWIDHSKGYFDTTAEYEKAGIAMPLILSSWMSKKDALTAERQAIDAVSRFRRWQIVNQRPTTR